MPIRNYKIYIDQHTRIIIYFLSQKRIILDFVVKIEYYFNESWHEMERFDCAHGSVHRDILDQRGNKKRIIWYSLLDFKNGLDFAIHEF